MRRTVLQERDRPYPDPVERAMNPQGEIVLRLESTDQLLEPCPPSPFLKRRLREDAEKYIIEQAEAIPRESKVKLMVSVPEREAGRAEGVSEAFHQHFAFRRGEAEKEIRRLRRFGWRSLLIGFVFLSLMMLMVELVKRYMPAGNASAVLQEGLTILGWIALWRPGELLLYEVYPLRRAAKTFSRLEYAEVQAVAD
jgi:hypothetical protein